MQNKLSKIKRKNNLLKQERTKKNKNFLSQKINKINDNEIIRD